MTPEQVTTLTYIGFIILGGFLWLAGGLLYVEYKTLKDQIPENHITAVVRALMERKGARGPIIAFLVSIVGLLAFIGGHLFWN